ncbi:MAG: S-layer homology domain-containing protein [Oscillospiraceae bacterium]|nr:S-layer homology domain-containing protein [Oscillospiraceae bacterium]
MENKCKRFLSLLLALVMVVGLMPMTYAHAEETAVYQAAETAATDLGLSNVGDSAKFVIVSAVSPGKEMVANVGTSSANYTGFELAPRSAADNVAANAVWTITMVENGYTVSNNGQNVAVKADHQVALEADAVVQIKKGNNGTDDWVIYSDGWCLNDHDSFAGAFSGTSGTANALSTYTNLVGGRSMLKLYAVTEVGTEPEPTEPGLLAHYTFESGDAANSVTTNETTTAALSGSAAVVELQNVAVPGKAMELSGAGGLQLTNIVNAAESSFTVSMWYKASATSGSNVNLAQAGTIGGSTGRTILILDPDSKYQTYVTGDNAKTPTTTAVSPTTWQHITFSYDMENSKAYFFVNGEADRAEGLSLSGTALSTADMIIGRHRNNGEGQFNGLIDEIRVYDKVLTAGEAKEIYDATAGNYAAPPVEPVDTVTLTVDVNDAQRIIDSSSIFGINHRYAFNGYGSFDSKTMQIKEDFKALYEDAGFGSIRYPGGTISNLFNWKTTIGPVAERKKQIHGFYNNSGQAGIAPNFGLTEIATFAESVDSEIVYVYSLGRGNAQDAADLIEYLNARVGTNPNGGIDWAAVRAENGHPEPYNVRYFEIGNEMQQAWGGSDGTASQGYWTTSVSAGAETAYIDGGTAVFNQQYAVCEEDWNAVASRTDGSANLVRYMRYANVNPKIQVDGKLVDDPSFKAVNDGVSVYVGGTQWTVVDSFENSGANDQHVVIDYSTGAIRFGDGVNGKIPAAGQQVTVSYSVDREGFIDVSKAIKETTAAINAAEGTSYEAHVYSSFETSGFISKMADRNANEWYDGLTIHPYSGTPDGSGDTFYDSAMLKAENVGIQNVQNYVNMMPADKVPVISEYGIFRSTDALVRSQTHAIYIAKVLMEYVRLGSPYIQKHCLIDWYSSGADSLGPTQQAVIQAVAGADANTVTGEGTFTFFSTPSAHVFKMLNSGFGDTIVATEFSEVPTLGNGAKALSALASVDESSNIYIAIVNASRTEDYAIALDLQGISGEGATVTAQVLTADSYAAQNSPENPNAVSVQELTLSGEWTQTIPKHTFVVLKIDPAGELDTTPVVGGFAVDKTELPTKGGEVTVSVTGRNLPNGIVIKSGEITATTTGNSIRQTAVLTFPANTTAENIVHNIQYSLDGETFVGDLSVTVFINRYDADDASRDIPVAVLTPTAGDWQTGHEDTEGPASLVLDGNTGTIWHTDWYGTTRTNHWIQFELSEGYTVDGLRYQPRQDGSINGIITGYEVQVSDDGATFRTVATGTWEGNSSWKIASFGGEQVRFVRLVSTDSLSDNASRVFASAAEIRLTGEKVEAPHEHTPAEAVRENEVPADCVNAGSYDSVVYCAECGEELSRESFPIPATGHTPAEAVRENEVPADCTTAGSYESVVYCSVCNEEISRQTVTVDALGHDFVDGKCTRCDEVQEQPVTNPFTDVPEDSFYYEPVLWAVENGVTNGSTATTFNPNGISLRGQIVTFLWRAAGSPEPETTENPFVDVKESDYFYKAVLWAYENEITKGVDDTHFAPTLDCTRAQVVTFLWRAKGSQNSTAVVEFTDVEADKYYTTAVAWAVENGITTGMGDGTFGVNVTCNRAYAVTFLYRAFK